MLSVRPLFHTRNSLASALRLIRVTTNILIHIIPCDDWQLCPLLQLLSRAVGDVIVRFVSCHVAMVGIPSTKVLNI